MTAPVREPHSHDKGVNRMQAITAGAVVLFRFFAYSHHNPLIRYGRRLHSVPLQGLMEACKIESHIILLRALIDCSAVTIPMDAGDCRFDNTTAGLHNKAIRLSF